MISSVGILNTLDQVLPRLHPRGRRRKAEPPQEDAVQAFPREVERHFVDARDVARGDDGFLVDVAEERDLPLQLALERAIRPAEQHIGLNTDGPQVTDAVLRRLRFQLAGRGDERHQREVDVERVLTADFLAELTDGFEEGLAFDVPDRSPDFNQQNVNILGCRPNAVLYFICNVRDDLNGAPEVVTASFLLNHREVDLSRCPVVIARGHQVGEPLVVAQVEVRLGAVVGHIDLAVLIRAHRAWIDVDVRVELLKGDFVSVTFEEAPDGCGGQTFTEGRNHAAGHEDVFDGSLSVCLSP